MEREILQIKTDRDENYIYVNTAVRKRNNYKEMDEGKIIKLKITGNKFETVQEYCMPPDLKDKYHRRFHIIDHENTENPEIIATGDYGLIIFDADGTVQEKNHKKTDQSAINIASYYVDALYVP